MHTYNAPGSLDCLNHLRSCAASNAQGGPCLHGCAAPSWYLGAGFHFGGEGLIVLGIALLHLTLRMSFGTWTGFDRSACHFWIGMDVHESEMVQSYRRRPGSAHEPGAEPRSLAVLASRACECLGRVSGSGVLTSTGEVDEQGL